MENVLSTLTRIDHAHAGHVAVSAFPVGPRLPPPEVVAAAAGLISERILTQVQTQAEQLSEHLQARQVELDRRESEGQALRQELEQERLAFRNWATERETALNERERQLQRDAAELDRRSAEIGTALAEKDRYIEAGGQKRAADRQTAARLLRRLRLRLQATREQLQLRASRLQQAEHAFARRIQHWEDERRRFATDLADLEAWSRRRQADFDQPRWQSPELQLQWAMRRQEFLQQVRAVSGTPPDGRSAA